LRLTALACVASLGVACSARPGELLGDISQAETMANGVELNGVKFNGVKFNGPSLNPLRLDGLTSGSTALTGVRVDGAKLSGTLPGGGVLLGPGLVGVALDASLDDGTHVRLRIDAVEPSSSDPQLERYLVSALVAGAAAYEPLCTASDGTAALAFPLLGSWDQSEGTTTGGSHVEDASVFTFACEGYALAKCVDFGYAPWRTATECLASNQCASRSLAAYHEACTRLLRADYCGDGTPTTRDGTQVDLWDAVGIQNDDETTWRLEAEWSQGGAVCVDAARWATLPDGEAVPAYVQQHCPARWSASGCGGATSTFPAKNGFAVDLTKRALLRSRIGP
jgi:hypothetical protein